MNRTLQILAAASFAVLLPFVLSNAPDLIRGNWPTGSLADYLRKSAGEIAFAAVLIAAQALPKRARPARQLPAVVRYPLYVAGLILSAVLAFVVTATLLEHGFGLHETAAASRANTIGKLALFGAGCYFFVLRKRKLVLPFSANPE